MSTVYFVPKVYIGNGSVELIQDSLNKYKNYLIVVDAGILNHPDFKLPQFMSSNLFPVDTSFEPTVEYVDLLAIHVREIVKLDCIVGIGGGATLDIAKALANLYTNTGSAAEYQGWDLVKNPSIYTIGIPTISGTGAESSKTCVLLNKQKNLKLGMNSPYSIFNEVVCDPDFLKTVPKNLFFSNTMDAFFHCMELLNGRFRNLFSDAYAEQALKLIDQIFTSENPMSIENLERSMLASFLGGSAIANSFVGIVHPLSAGLSTVLGIKHCISNCIVMQGMEEFYPKEYELFMRYKEKHGYVIPTGIAKDLKNSDYQNLYQASVCHQKPLMNALGEKYLEILDFDKVKSLFEKM